MRGFGATWLLVVAAAAAMLAAACGSSEQQMLTRRNPVTGQLEQVEAEGTDQSAVQAGGSGKDYFAANVHPMLAQKCGACHDQGGSGNPAWIFKGDAAKSYDLVYALGYVTPTGSRLVDKGVHSGGGGPALTDGEKTTVLAWVAMEVTAGTAKAGPSKLEKFGGCLDATKFAEIGLEKLVTTRRQAANNTNNVQPWEEGANTCTGCDNTPCRACHSLDDATGFILALGNPNLPANITFEETKKVTPAYLQKYVTAGPDGNPMKSDGLLKKAAATTKDRAHTHPMFVITPDMQSRIDAFVNDALVRYAAKQCGQ